MISISLKDLLDYLNLNKTQFASMVGVTEQTVVRWSNNKNSPTIENLRIINDYFQKNDVPYHILDIKW